MTYKQVDERTKIGFSLNPKTVEKIKKLRDDISEKNSYRRYQYTMSDATEMLLSLGFDNLPDDLKTDQRRINKSSRTGNELLEEYIRDLDWAVGKSKSITEIKLGLEGKAGSFESNHRVKELTTALEATGHVKKRKRNDKGQYKRVWMKKPVTLPNAPTQNRFWEKSRNELLEEKAALFRQNIQEDN